MTPRDTSYQCVRCHRNTLGRFTRPKLSSGHGWSQGMTRPCWWCWACLPYGEGRAEPPPLKVKQS